MYIHKYHKQRSENNHSGFTLIELLVVVSIIGMLASIVLVSLESARESARLSRAKAELAQIYTALELYLQETGGVYPPDVDRSLPNGIEKHLSGGNWPDAPWPGSVYDWDNWPPSYLSYPPLGQVLQISIRFCEGGDCIFPKQPWVDNTWNDSSAVYYCISGTCRAHNGAPVSEPGYCIMGTCP